MPGRAQGEQLVVMDLFGRYVFRQTASSFLLILLTLTAIVWLATALKQLDLLTSKGQSFYLFLQMTALALPNLMAMIAPNALLLATLQTLDRLNGDSELIIMTASGASVRRLSIPFISLAALLAAVLLVMNLYIMPLSLRTLRVFINQVRTDLISQVMRPGLFSSPENGVTFHIQDRALNGDLLGLVVQDERSDETQSMTYLAKRGQIVNSGERSYLVMREGHIHRRPKAAPDKDQEVQIVAFEQYIFDISQYGATDEQAEYKPRERYLGELVNPDADDPYYKRYPGNFRSELHERFASLLYPFVFIAIPLWFLGTPRTARESRWKALFVAFGVAVLVRIAGLAATNLLTQKAWAVLLVYGIPGTAIIVAGLAAHARMIPKARSWPILGGLPKYRFYKKKFLTGRGTQAGQQGGRV
ncbi:MAG: LptF/LptG family permease [Pseudomonadota bacterium]|nr:LptF/LptG family permease [Pseudomonadota bacterium]